MKAALIANASDPIRANFLQVVSQSHAAGDDWLEKAEIRQPFGRLIKPTEVAELAAFLLSEKSGLITGSIIDFDQNFVGTQS